MKIAIKPTEIKLVLTEENKEEIFIVAFQFVAMKKNDLETFISKLNEENEFIMDVN